MLMALRRREVTGVSEKNTGGGESDSERAFSESPTQGLMNAMNTRNSHR